VRSCVKPEEGTVVAAETPPPDEQERTLVERARGRDPEAFGALYDLHVEAVYKYLYYRLGNSAECEDLAEQVFLKAWEAIDRYEWRGRPFLAWLYRVAHNTLVDQRRAERPRVPLEDVLADLPTREDALEHALTAEMLAAALRQLTPEQAQVITLRFLVGWSNAEIAAEMNRQEPAIRALQLRGLHALRRLLAGDQP
jgi:RNA polymerase sigma-70 factor, ECF subfamily